MPTDYKKQAILKRIKSIELDVVKGREYLESGAHSEWSGFKAMFSPKYKDGKELPPHKDWVKNVFLPSRERAMKKAEKLLDKFE